MAVAPSSSVTRTPTVAGPFCMNVVVASGIVPVAVSYDAVAVEVEGVGDDAAVGVGGLRAEGERLAGDRLRCSGLMKATVGAWSACDAARSRRRSRSARRRRSRAGARRRCRAG